MILVSESLASPVNELSKGRTKSFKIQHIEGDGIQNSF